MSAAERLYLEQGRVYRTRDLVRFGADTSKLAKRLVEDGALVPLDHGLYMHPKPGRFGVVPPTDEELVRAYLGGLPFVFTGPERWNELGLCTLPVYASTLVYNLRRAGAPRLGGRPFLFRRVPFPQPDPSAEWFVVDMLEHGDPVVTGSERCVDALRAAVSVGRLDREALFESAASYGSRKTAHFIRRSLLGIHRGNHRQ